MKSSSLIILVFLSFLLFALNINADIEKIEWKESTIREFNKNQTIKFTLPQLSERDLQSTLYIRAQLTKQFKKLILEPQIRLSSSKQKLIVICNQVASKFSQMCSIKLKDIQSLEQQNPLELQITSLVQAEIQIEVYLDSKYRINLGEELLLWDDEEITKEQGNDHSQLLLMQVPHDIEDFQFLQLSLMPMLKQRSDSSSNPLMFISHASPIQQLEKQYQSDTILLSSGSGIISLSNAQIHSGDYILINITLKGKVDRHLFSSRLSVKDTQFSSDKTISVLGLNSYSQFELKQNEQQLLLRYDIPKMLAEEQSLQFVVYQVNRLNDHREQQMGNVKMHILTANAEQTTIQIQPRLSQEQQTVAHFNIPHTYLQQLQSDQFSHLYLKLSNLPSLASFYLTLRSYQTYRFIQQQWPQFIHFDTQSAIDNSNSSVNTNASSPTQLTNTNDHHFLYEDSLLIKSASRQTKHQYFIQLNNLINQINNNDQVKVSLKVDRCISIQSEGNLQCLENKEQSSSQPLNQAKNEIVVKVQHSQKQKHKIIFSFEYQLSDCPILTYSKQYSVHKCYFNLHFHVESNLASLKPVSFVLHKLPSHIPLIAPSKSYNYQSHYTLTQGTQAYFYLSIPSGQSTQGKTVNQKSTVHLTTYSGDCILFGSRQSNYPQYGLIESQNYDIGTGGFLQIDKLTESNQQFKYFVAVYCYSQSEFDIEVATNYNEEYKKFGNEIPLREGYAQEFSLRGNDGLRFVVENNSSEVQNYWIEIDELQGSIQYQLVQIDNSESNSGKQISCPSQEYRQKTCKFPISGHSRGVFTVTSKSEGLTKFIILVKSQSTVNQCHYYPSDRPQFILLQPEQTVCTRFKVTRYDDLMVSLSALSQTEMLINRLEMYVVFNQNSDKVVVEGMARFFGKEQLKKLCQGTNGDDLIVDCQMQVIVKPINSVPSSALMQLISFTNEQSQLLNHIMHHSTVNSLSKYNYKQFYYYIQSVNLENDSANGITLKVSSQNDHDLVIVVKTQNTRRFEVSPDDYYGVYPEVQNMNRFVVKLTEGIRNAQVNIPIDILQCQGININEENTNEEQRSTHLSRETSNTLTPQCVVLISVFGVNQQQQPEQQFIYSIELTQTNTLAPITTIHRQSNNQQLTIFNPQRYYRSLKQLGFAKLMWIIIILVLFCIVLYILIARLCKAISHKDTNDKFSYGANSPRIVITKPTLQDTNSSITDTSVDSYGFNPSPPSSTTDVIVNYYEMSRDDGIVEAQQQTNRKNSHKRDEPYPEMSSPTSN